MCGIGAILRTDGKLIPERWLDAIDARIAYRGPDGKGRFRDRQEIKTPQGKRVIEVALVHRRLSIIDHRGGGQPMVSERGRNKNEGLVAVVFNGCIYNHGRLRKELHARGHRFITDHSDTEVLIHGHREWGADLQRHLQGMYAYVIWDRRRASLTMARDWFGEKPLYQYTEGDGDGVRLLVVCSDASGAGSIPPTRTPAGRDDLRSWIARYLQLGYAGDIQTICARGTSVHSVQPSGPMHIPDAAPSQTSEPKQASSAAPSKESHDIERLIERAVYRQLEADVQLGCFLSGGVDSSLIAHFAKRRKGDLRTFSVKMPEQRFDESEYAEHVAKHLGTDHTTLSVAANPTEDLTRLIRTLGQPFGDSSILPTYWVSKAAREHVKVALSGDGGDELFIGYERYLAAEVLAKHWRVLSKMPSGLLKWSHPKSRLHKLDRLKHMACDFSALGVLATESVFTQRQIRDLLGEPPHEPAGCDPGDDPLAALRYADLQGYLPDDLLRKVDTASMAVALEVRCPYLDCDLAGAVLDTPIQQLIPNGQRKGLLRRIAAKHLPREIVNRPKMGFAIPIGRWFRTDFGGMRVMMLDYLRSPDPFGPIPIERREVRRLVDEHMSGQRDHSHRLFALLTLSMWAKSI